MPATLATAPNALITVNKVSPFLETVCLWAETKGGAVAKREIVVEVCGTKPVSLNGPDTHTFDILYRDNDEVILGQRYKKLDLDFLNQRFTTLSSPCQATEWEIFDSDGITLLVDSAFIKI